MQICNQDAPCSPKRSTEVDSQSTAMPNTSYGKYLEGEVFGADPLKLVQMLYRGAMESVAAARRHLAEGEVRERSRRITRAWEILQELSGSLDHSQGGTVSRGLAGLYAYMQGRLIEANQKQSDAPLAEVELLMGTLAQAWDSVAAAA